MKRDYLAEYEKLSQDRIKLGIVKEACLTDQLELGEQVHNYLMDLLHVFRKRVYAALKPLRDSGQPLVIRVIDQYYVVDKVLGYFVERKDWTNVPVNDKEWSYVPFEVDVNVLIRGARVHKILDTHSAEWFSTRTVKMQNIKFTMDAPIDLELEWNKKDNNVNLVPITSEQFGKLIKLIKEGMFVTPSLTGFFDCITNEIGIKWVL